MTTAIANKTEADCPGWIPDDIVDGWNPSPFAYQTEEEEMPAGGLHGYFLSYILELLRHLLEHRGQMLLMDVFLLYRDGRGTKRRIAPDLILVPFHFPPSSAWDLDTAAPPKLVIEVTSPKSHLADKEAKVELYQQLGIESYLVIDAITPGSKMRRQISLHYWRMENAILTPVTPDEDDGFVIDTIHAHIMAEGQTLRFVNMSTGDVLLDSGKLSQELEEEKQARKQAENNARQDREARKQAESELARLQAELKKLRGEG